MKKREIFWYGALCVTLLLLMGADVSAVGWEDMEVLKYDFEISTNPPAVYGMKSASAFIGITWIAIISQWPTGVPQKHEFIINGVVLNERIPLIAGRIG